MKPLLLLLTLVLACLLALAACGDTGGETVAPEDPSIKGSQRYDPYYGAALASVEERIWLADIIVRATLESTTGVSLNFRAVEYLKGTGPTTFTVQADTVGRPTQWDNQEAVLFLSRGSGAQGRASSTSSAFEFADTTEWKFWDLGWEPTREYTGTLPEGYTIGSRNPVWLPASTAGGTRSASSSTPSSYEPGDGPSISLADLRTKIAWVEGGAGVDGYDDCIAASLAHMRFFRDWETYHGQPWQMKQAERETASGLAAGRVLSEDHSSDYLPPPQRYPVRWLTGQDATLFSVGVVDDDADSTNGFGTRLTTARPLPGGTFRFVGRIQSGEYVPCNFVPEHHGLEWTVTVAAPADTLHEALFDPAAIGAAVGADAANGVVEPAGFTVGGTATTLQALKWESGVVTMELSPAASLSGYDMDVIELDGSISVTLSVADATSNAGGRLTWAVANQPWHVGDQLMLRLRTA